MRIVFWQNLLSFYQVPHLTALASYPGVEVIWVVQQVINPDRIAQGWKVPEVHGVRVVVAPDDAEIQTLINLRPEESVHVFSGIHQEVTTRKAFYLARKTKARIGLLTEPPFPGKLRDLISPWFHGIHRVFYGRRISFVLAIGTMAVDFYQSVGYPSAMVFPYGYFPAGPSEPSTALPANEKFHILYLGQLIERKGVDTLLTALGQLTDLEWSLTIIGSGGQQETLMALGRSLDLEERLTFHAALENQAAMQLVARSDVFVLPSRHDGWGVVVNEALLRGVPVICSDHCGAADLLADRWRGETFSAGSAESLAKVMRRWITRGRRIHQETERIQHWSKCIEGESAAAYLLKAIQFTMGKAPRPLPPWRKAAESADTSSGGTNGTLAVKN